MTQQTLSQKIKAVLTNQWFVISAYHLVVLYVSTVWYSPITEFQLANVNGEATLWLYSIRDECIPVNLLCTLFVMVSSLRFGYSFRIKFDDDYDLYLPILVFIFLQFIYCFYRLDIFQDMIFEKPVYAYKSCYVRVPKLEFDQIYKKCDNVDGIDVPKCLLYKRLVFFSCGSINHPKRHIKTCDCAVLFTH